MNFCKKKNLKRQEILIQKDCKFKILTPNLKRNYFQKGFSSSFSFSSFSSRLFFCLLFFRSEVEFLLQNYEEAKQDARRAQSCASNWWEAYFREGVVLHELGKYGKAITAFDYALFLSPENSVRKHSSYFFNF